MGMDNGGITPHQRAVIANAIKRKMHESIPSEAIVGVDAFVDSEGFIQNLRVWGSTFVMTTIEVRQEDARSEPDPDLVRRLEVIEAEHKVKLVAPAADSATAEQERVAAARDAVRYAHSQLLSAQEANIRAEIEADLASDAERAAEQVFKDAEQAFDTAVRDEMRAEAKR